MINENNTTYNYGHIYALDFVVEAEQIVCLVEVRGRNKANNSDMIVEKNAAYSIAS